VKRELKKLAKDVAKQKSLSGGYKLMKARQKAFAKAEAFMETIRIPRDYLTRKAP
jgi:hypothetical protein